MVSTMIYAMCDPDTEEVRYIGKTSTSLSDRLKVHIHRARRNTKSHRAAWVKGLLNQGKRPLMFVVEVVAPGIDWREREKWWIEFARGQGFQLTNMTNGGDGVEGYVPTESHREQVRQQMLGNQHAKGRMWTPGERSNHEAASISRHCPNTKGSKNSRALLTESNVIEIRQRHAGGEREKELALEYGVHHSTMNAILHRRSWRHV